VAQDPLKSVRVHRLEEEMREAALLATEVNGFSSHARDGEQRQRPGACLRAELLGQAVAVHARHGKVEQGHIRLKGDSLRQRLGSRAGRADFMTPEPDHQRHA
jgi:hypothetical protein